MEKIKTNPVIARIIVKGLIADYSVSVAGLNGINEKELSDLLVEISRELYA